jgi:hypothetical protein
MVGPLSGRRRTKRTPWPRARSNDVDQRRAKARLIKSLSKRPVWKNAFELCKRRFRQPKAEQMAGEQRARKTRNSELFPSLQISRRRFDSHRT